MSDTNNIPDFSLYNQFLQDIKNDLDKEITKQFRNKNNGIGMKFNDIESLLKQADTAALGVGAMISGLSKNNVTYAIVKAEIDKSMQEIKGKIDNFKNNVVTDKKDKSQLNRMVEANIDKGKTSKALDAFAELHKEDGKFKRDDVDKRINAAKKEKDMAEKMLAQRKDYDRAIMVYIAGNPPAGTTDAEKALNNEFKDLKTANESWKNETQRLQRIGSYDYERKLEDLIDLANSQTDVTPELAKEFKMFRKRVKDFSNDSISKYFDTIDKDPTNEDIDTIRNILNNFSSVDLQNETEMKEPEKVLETLKKDYKNLVSGKMVSGVELTYIFEAFPDMQNEILSEIEAGNTGKIDRILMQTGKMLQSFPKKDVNQLKYEKEHAARKISEYEREKETIEHNSNPDAPQEEPQAPEDAVTDELDLTDLVGEDFKLKVKDKDAEGNSINFDFAIIDNDNENGKNLIVDEAYKELCKDPIAHRKAVEKLLPTVPKKFDYRKLPIIHALNKAYRKIKKLPPLEVEKTESAIKNALKQKIEGRIAKGEEIAQYTKDEQAYRHNFELTNKEKAKFNKSMAEIITEYAKAGKNMKAGQMKKEAEDRVLDRDDD